MTTRSTLKLIKTLLRIPKRLYQNYGFGPRIIPVDTVFKIKSKPETEFIDHIKVASAKTQSQIKKINEHMAKYEIARDVPIN